jgi:tRNA modification GTPase
VASPPPEDTIVAVATPRGQGAIGIVRISGPEALAVARRLAPRLPVEPTPRHAYWTPLISGDGGPMDEALALYFAPGASTTGEPVVELHSHGSPRVQSLLLQGLVAEGRARLARPGEFTQRAFLNGRIDLARAEAVADLIAAEGEAAVRAAAAQLAGALGDALRTVRHLLSELQADLEALLNFPEEAAEVEPGIGDRLSRSRVELGRLLATARTGRLLRRGASVVLAGPVNAGKSSLFNRLVGEERALVDLEPGTTRDVLEARGELEGLPVTWVDTAGFRDSPGRVEALGLERARTAIRSADLVLLVLPCGTPEPERSHWRGELGAVTSLPVASKSDLAGAGQGEGLPVSALTGDGLDSLRRSVLEVLRGGGLADSAAQISERHAEALGRAEEALEQAEGALAGNALEVVAGEVGAALQALGEITGETASEEVLAAIFSRFCIGK